MARARIRFKQAIGKLAKIEGSADCGDGAIEFELAMTESISGPVKGVVKRSIAYSDLEEVAFRRRFLRRSILTFSARNLETFSSMPRARGYEFVVTPLGSAAEIQSFVTEARLAIAQATMDRFSKQIEESI